MLRGLREFSSKVYRIRYVDAAALVSGLKPFKGWVLYASLLDHSGQLYVPYCGQHLLYIAVV